MSSSMEHINRIKAAKSTINEKLVEMTLIDSTDTAIDTSATALKSAEVYGEDEGLTYDAEQGVITAEAGYHTLPDSQELPYLPTAGGTVTGDLNVEGEIHASSIYGDVAWSNVIDKPEKFPPQPHLHEGYATLDSTGKVPASQLPSYVDDVEEYTLVANFPQPGEAGKIYIDTDTNKSYRWSGSSYVEISSSLALGENSSTAYRGDRGKVAYDHSQAAHAPSNAEKNTIVGVQKNGVDISPDANRKVNITVPTKVSELTNDSGYAKTSDLSTFAPSSHNHNSVLDEEGDPVTFQNSGSGDTDSPIAVWNGNSINSISQGSIAAGSAKSVPWSGVTDPPTIPTKTSQLTNDSGYITSSTLNNYYTDVQIDAKVDDLNSQLDDLNSQLDDKSGLGHNHTKSQITDFPSSMPASDVYSWAKASSKPSYTHSEVGAPSKTGDGASGTWPINISGGLYDVDGDTAYNFDASNMTYESGNDLVFEQGGSLGLVDPSSVSVGYASSAGSAGSVAWSNVSGKPTIPSVGNGTVTIKQNGTSKGSFTMNQSGNTTIELTDTDTNSNTTYSLSKSGSTITLTGSDGSKTSVTDADTNTTYGVATTSAAGLMSSTDKAKLDGIAAGANNYTYTLPTATSSALGGVKIGYTQSGKNYPVQLSDGKMYVNVPWTDTNTDSNTTYSLSKSGSTITLTGSDGSKTSVTDSDSNTNTTYSLSKSGSTITLTGSDGSKTSVTDADTNTNTWRGIQDNLTSSSTSDSLSANQGRILKNRIDAADAQLIELSDSFDAHSHSWSEISDKPSSMPASDVYAWAKASSKPSYSWSEITSKPSSMPASDVYSWAKASSKPSYSWSEITSKPSTFSPSSHDHGNVTGQYDGSGGRRAPNAIGTYNNKFHMGNEAGDGYQDWIHMNNYSWSDVPYATMIGVTKAATPSAYIASGGNSSSTSAWTIYKLLDSNNFASYAAKASHSHSYNDLSNKPTIPSVYNPTITITQNGTTKGSFTLNQSGNATIALSDTNTDTNTHYTTRIYAGASGAASNAAATNPYIKITDDNTYRNQIRLLGVGATSVSSDASGNITISSSNTTYSAATTSAAGLMSAADKSKLDGIASGANNYTYTLPPATSALLGGVKVGSNITLSSGTISLTKANVTAALGYTPPTSDTNTWRGVQDNLTSTATDQSLSANQGRVLKGLVDGKASSSHSHAWGDITGKPSTFTPASHNHSSAVTISGSTISVSNGLYTFAGYSPSGSDDVNYGDSGTGFMVVNGSAALITIFYVSAYGLASTRLTVSSGTIPKSFYIWYYSEGNATYDSVDFIVSSMTKIIGF